MKYRRSSQGGFDVDLSNDFEISDSYLIIQHFRCPVGHLRVSIGEDEYEVIMYNVSAAFCSPMIWVSYIIAYGKNIEFDKLSKCTLAY